MFFAGLTSAYIVSMGDSFWLKTPLPNAFWVSTAILALSSISIEYAVKSSKRKVKKSIRIGIMLTLLLGLSFVYFQFRGFNQLKDNGQFFTKNFIMVNKGKYGEKYEILIKNKEIKLDGNNYQVKQNNSFKNLSSTQLSELKTFLKQFVPENNMKMTDSVRLEWSKNSKKHNFQPNKKFKLKLNKKNVSIKNNKLFLNDTLKLKGTEIEELIYLSDNIIKGRGTFFCKGQIGKDFNIYFNGFELTYKYGDFYNIEFKHKVQEGETLENLIKKYTTVDIHSSEKYNFLLNKTKKLNNLNSNKITKGQELIIPNKLSDTQTVKALLTADSGTTYLYALFGLHLLHILVALIYLIKICIQSFKGEFDNGDFLKLRLGSIFWHFFGFLWLYLVVFLLFIH